MNPEEAEFGLADEILRTLVHERAEASKASLQTIDGGLVQNLFVPISMSGIALLVHGGAYAVETRDGERIAITGQVTKGAQVLCRLARCFQTTAYFVILVRLILLDGAYGTHRS